MASALCDRERRTILFRLLRTTAAADQLARRRYATESLRLYEEVVARLDTLDDHASEVRYRSTERRTAPPPGEGRTGTEVERIAELRGSIAAGLRAHFHDLVQLGDGLRNWIRRTSAGAVGTGLVAVAVSFWFSGAKHDLAEGATWEASSAASGAEKTGVIAKLGVFGDVPNYFFHTENEKGAHIDIDLGAKHTVDSVEITNRIDCCTERARRLEVWLGDAPDGFRRVAVRKAHDGSRSFGIDIGGRMGRYVRIALPSKGMLHLARVRVFGR